MQIILNGKTYESPAPKARMVREAVEITEEIDFGDIKAKDIDKLVNYVVKLYDNNFSIDDVYDGLEAEKLIPTLTESIEGVLGKMGAKLEEFPKNE